MSQQTAPKTHFGLAALIMGTLCVFALLSNYEVANLRISQDTFNLLNNLTALFYCVSTQAAIALGVIGHTRKNDSKNLSRLGIALTLVPFLVVFLPFLYAYFSSPPP